jgi:hypothetical protein
MSVMHEIVCAYRIQYRMSCTILYVYVQYRMLPYNIICKFGHRMLDTTLVHQYTYDIVCLF